MPSGRAPISTRSAIARMIAMPSPPSDSSFGDPSAVCRIEPFALVDHLDHEPVGEQQVGDLDDAGVLLSRTRAGPNWTRLP